MTDKPIDKKTMLQIYSNGTYYSPANKHYGSDLVNVVCDRCFKNNLDICVGWLTHDLCLQCVTEIGNKINNKVDKAEKIDKVDKAEKTEKVEKVEKVKEGNTKPRIRSMPKKMMQRQYRRK